MDKKLKLEELVLLINGPNRTGCMKILEDHKDIINTSYGSLSKHQAWKGGYRDHLEETMNFAIPLFNLMAEKRSLPFTLSDVLTMLFLHDIEKPFKYSPKGLVIETEEDKWLFFEKIVKDYKINMSEAYWNAFQYTHGEGKDFDRRKRIQEPLAAFIHICDTVSARIWFDYPQGKEKSAYGLK